MNNPIVENISLTGIRDFIKSSKDERQGRQFRGTQVIHAFTIVHIDTLRLLLVH